MKVVGISGSPRTGGNSDILLDCVLEGAMCAGARVVKVALSGLSFSPCLECGGCDTSGVCVLRDDLEPLYGTIGSADALVVAAPIFFGSVSAQLKMMIDRFQCRWIAKYVLKARRPVKKKRRGVFLCVAGERRKKAFTNAGAVIRAFFATVDTEYSGELLCGAVEKKGDVVKDKRSLRRAFELGRSLV